MFTSRTAALLSASLQAGHSLSVRFEATLGRDFDVVFNGDDVSVIIKSKRAANTFKAFSELVSKRATDWFARPFEAVEPRVENLDDDALMFLGARFSDEGVPRHD